MYASAIKIILTPVNTTIKTVKDFENIPLFKGGVQNLYLKDVAIVEDGADITSSYALVNGKRSVYLAITKSADASTWEVVQNLKKAIPRFQALLPDDVKLSYEFDQSGYVINAVKSLLSEGAIGAILTGLMVLLFLGDPRGALIVIMTIPISIIAGILFLSLFHQTINIMTLSGLSLAIGILVDNQPSPSKIFTSTWICTSQRPWPSGMPVRKLLFQNCSSCFVFWQYLHPPSP